MARSVQRIGTKGLFGAATSRLVSIGTKGLFETYTVITAAPVHKERKTYSDREAAEVKKVAFIRVHRRDR